MPLDVKTLYILNIVVASVTAAICFSSWFRHRDIVGLRGWALGLSLGALGSLVLSVRTPASSIWLAIIGNTVIVAGYTTVWTSVRRFNDVSVDLRHALLPVGLFVVPFTIASLVGADVRIRVVMVSATIAILCLLAGRDAFRARLGEPLGSRVLTSASFLVIAMAMAVRTGFATFAERTADNTFYDPTQGATLFVNTVCVVALTLGLLMMANERLQLRYEKMAFTDELTGLPNRRFFLEDGERRLGRPDASAKPVASILMMDLDHFSDVNRMFGHAGGDQALVAFAVFAREHLRPADLIARYGGEEFCALLEDTDEGEARRIAERLRTEIAGMPIDLGGRPLTITVSIGLAPFVSDLQASIRDADIALYRAKALGRNLVCSASDDPRKAPAP
jgi:diguanylate cyclase (GGDEF)-like protein